MNLGTLLLFTDQVYRRRGDRITADRAFLLFVQSFVPTFDRILFLGRVGSEPGEAPYLCTPHLNHEFHELPYYESLHKPIGFLSSLAGGLRAAWTAVGKSRALLLGIPHPWGVLLWGMGVLRRRPVIFLVRQDLRARVRLRPRGLRKLLGSITVLFLEDLFVFLSRWTLTFTIGGAMRERYARFGGPVFPAFISLISSEALAASKPRESPSANFTPRLLCVGRLHPDKGLHVLFGALQRILRAGSPAPVLDLVGEGPLEHVLRSRVGEMGLGERVLFHGYVPFGPRLERLYREATLFVLPSDSEGFPQVIFEAAGAALPIVCTAVGGIPSTMRDRVDALLVPPRDPEALAQTVMGVLGDPALYARMSAGALAFARLHTLEAERDRMLARITSYLNSKGGSA